MATRLLAAAPLARRVAPTVRMHSRALSTSRPLFADEQKKAMTMTTTEDGIAIVTFDIPGEKMNTLSMKLAGEVRDLFEKIEKDPKIKAAVLISGKPDNFIAGADINMFTACKTSEEMYNISRPSQLMFDQLESGKPKVAAINGACMGGGLELALACHYRVASTSPKTVLSLPEVMLGILPGAGGTQRLPKLIGLQAAMPMILTGSQVRADKARKIKLVDQVADPKALLPAAIQAARGLADGSLKVNREPSGLVAKLTKKVIEETEFGRKFAFKKAREMVMKQTSGNYPSPLKIIDVLEQSAKEGFGSEVGYVAEARAFGELGMTPESRALVSIFFGKKACEKNPFPKPANTVKTVGVLGAGLMGAGIAEVTVVKGYDVFLKDATEEGLARGLDAIYKNLDTKVKKRKLSSFERDRTMSSIMGLTNNDATAPKFFAKADMIIEAVFEKLELKHQVIRDVEAMTPAHCIFASNTSAIPITKLAEASKRPDKFIGMHYFSPVNKMPLLEIIRHPGTSDDTTSAAFAMGLKQGKVPIIVKDVPGFFVNRCLGPYSDEGLAVLLDGASPKDIDKALLKYGYPVGPMTLLDEVGIDVAASVGRNLASDLGIRVGNANPEVINEVLSKGWLGRKTGKGVFVYPKGGKKSLNPEFEELVQNVRKKAGKASSGLTSTEDIQMRMVTRFVNEAALCLQDGIIANPVTGDIGAVFGIGFPPFRGGPFRLLDSMGTQKFIDTMLRYRDVLGPQFEPAQILKDYAKSGKKFHSS